ncbi:hypothetical protein LSCM1_04755 [Leishmania martiniquensis]|uniref:Uncharacterized protein n=1 Tax=Leishmania martiniquensis TaxID=1580590 RepID=A0A836H8G3_9TRYP|nr:hypothetical protein LSCM1_04755 [Leishmania martiniquensis]
MPPAPHNGLRNCVYRFLRRYCLPATLTVRMHFGESLSRVRQLQSDLTARRKQALVKQIEACLATRGVALLADDADMAYYAIFPEYFTAEGVPESWARYKRQYEAARKRTEAKHCASAAARAAQQKQASVALAPSGDAAAAHDWGRNLDEECKRAAQAEAAAHEQERSESVVVPEHILPLVYRQLWAYFYAFMHCRAVRLRRERLLTRINDGVEDAHKNSSLQGERLHVINALRADGLLDESLSDMGGTPCSPAQFDQMTSPTFPTPAEPHMKAVCPSLTNAEGGGGGR